MERHLLLGTLLLAGVCLACEARRSDQTITQDFAKLAQQRPDLSNGDVRAISEDGRVTLRGFVYTEQARESAEDLAEDIAGVKNVKNDIQVVPQAEAAPVPPIPPPSETVPDDLEPSPSVPPTPTPETEREIDDAR